MEIMKRGRRILLMFVETQVNNSTLQKQSKKKKKKKKLDLYEIALPVSRDSTRHTFRFYFGKIEECKL